MATPSPQAPLRPLQPSPAETHKSLLLLAATALAAGATAGALSYILIVKTRPARQRRRKSLSDSVRRTSGVSEDLSSAEHAVTRRSSQPSGAELPPQPHAQHQRDPGAPAGRAAQLRRHERGSNQTLAEAGRLASVGSAGRRMDDARSGSSAVSSPFQAQSTAASAGHAAGRDASAAGSQAQRSLAAAGAAATPEQSGHRSRGGSSNMSSLRSCSSLPVPLSSG